jgi:cell division protein YceG involved in septum cleavage
MKNISNRTILCLIVVVSLVTGILFSGYKANAEENPSEHVVKEEQKAVLTITDPSSGQTWSWNLPSQNIISSGSQTRVAANHSTIFVSFDAGEYLQKTLLSLPSKASTINDNITITAGFTYSMNASANTVTIYSAFGSTTPKGLYYATDRVFYWRNPGSLGGGKFYPTTNSWSYAGDKKPGQYYASLPPVMK